jgi:hypothetical protein
LVGDAPALVGPSITDNAWHHIAWVFSAGTRTLYLDGTRVDSSSASYTPVASGDLGAIGGHLFSGTYDTTASVDEVRYSSSARYSGASYTVPTAAFTDDADTTALFHCEADMTDSHDAAISTTEIAPDDANLVYSPFNWDVQAARAKTINPGAYVRALIGGSPNAIVAKFNMTGVTSAPKILYRVDDGPWTAVTVAATVALTFPASNDWTNHLVQIVVKINDYASTDRWTTDASAVKFTGFTVTGGAPATRAIEQRGLVGLAYGDSITEGLSTLKASGGVVAADSTQGYAFMLADLLGAEIGVVAFGGTGVATTYRDVPAWPDTYDLIFDAATSPARDFADPEPDFILVNHGTNDGAGTGNSWRDAYLAVVNALLAATSSTQLVLMRPFSGAHAAAISYVATNCDEPARATYVDTTGWLDLLTDTTGIDQIHPTGYINATQLAPKTAAAVRAAIGTGGGTGATYLKLAGGSLKLIALAS